MDILSVIQTEEDGEAIIDHLREPIEDEISTLILTISLYFIGDSSHLRDKNDDLISNLRCKKLSDFQWYKTTFLSIFFLHKDSNQPL